MTPCSTSTSRPEVSDQDPAAALIEAAQRHDARAIVLGSKPHSRLHEALGTVTTELLQTSPVPVITVPLPSRAPAVRSCSPPPQGESAERSAISVAPRITATSSATLPPSGRGWVARASAS